MNRLLPPWFRRRRTGDADDDGFGQSMLEDIRFLLRFRRCRSHPVEWLPPTPEETRWWDGHAIIGRFGDMHGLASVNGEQWIVRERLWHGWPDPPRFAFFALAGDRIRVAVDFHGWPQAWRLRPATDQRGRPPPPA